LSYLTVYDPDNAYPAGFLLSVSPGLNYTVSGQTITPAVNFAGTLTVPVRVNDGINNSSTFDFKLQVNQINDAPVFAPIGNLQVPENAPPGSLTITDISKGPMEDDQHLTFVASSSNAAIIGDPVIQYNGTAATATLSYIVKPNVSGVVTITIVAIDNGSNVAPHQNSYSSSFQIDVLEINTAPTLNAISNITLLEDAEQQNITLTGISAGAGETQVLTISVSSNKPEYFDLLQVAYTSPEVTGLLQFKPKQDVFGTVQLSVTVTDNGSGVSPHVNRVTRIFSVVIQPVNDPPFFTSKPVVVAAINEQYLYNVTATDPDGEKITLSAPSKPAWASLGSVSNGKATLQGKPTAGSVGNASVTLQVKDAGSTVQQSFSIYVNIRPSVTSLSMITEEDTPAMIPATLFQSGYSDPNNNPLAAIRITALPAEGKLLLSDAEVKPGDTISVSSLSGLKYTPNENYFGMDSFGWSAFDGYHFSVAPARVDVSVLSINDAPVVILGNDTLHYEVNGEPDLISPLADILDADDDTLSHAVVGFHARNYNPQVDWLEFQNTGNIRGSFDFQSGALRLTGIAPLSEYRMALRSVRYIHRNTIDPLLEPKALYITVHDGETESAPKEKVIILEYTFVEFEIPSGFTPNGDQANDTWIIDRAGGGLEEMDKAIISVYNKQGVLVFRTKGFDRPWDGTMNGDLLPADSYFFTIDLQLRNKKTYKGIVTILR
jgi:gliding motility-associated-like protein